jgi:DNA-binding GntR family transcriptional regulator
MTDEANPPKVGFKYIADELRERIETGAAGWEAGDAIPSEARLAAEWSVNRSTIRHALDILEAESLIFTIVGRGHFVKSASNVRNPSTRFEEIAASLRRDITTGALPAGTQLDSELKLAERFGVSQGPVRQALRTLRSEGLIVSVHGRGWFVAGATAPLTRAGEIAASLTARIRGGELAHGSALPGEIALASEFGVAKGTMRRALTLLEEEGLIQRTPGRSRVVTFDPHSNEG